MVNIDNTAPLDIIFRVSAPIHAYEVFVADGNQGFISQEPLEPHATTRSPIVADLGHDLTQDLIVCKEDVQNPVNMESTPPGIIVYPGGESGGFQGPVEALLPDLAIPGFDEHTGIETFRCDDMILLEEAGRTSIVMIGATVRPGGLQAEVALTFEAGPGPTVSFVRGERLGPDPSLPLSVADLSGDGLPELLSNGEDGMWRFFEASKLHAFSAMDSSSLLVSAGDSEQ